MSKPTHTRPKTKDHFNIVKVREYPDIDDLSNKVRFNPSHGDIRLGNDRMVLLHTFSYAEQRREIIDALGLDKARELFTRIGYNQGVAEAKIGRNIRPHDILADSLSLGPQFRAIKGFTAVEPVRLEFNVEQGYMYFEVIWHDSVESESHLKHFAVGTTNACWGEVGAAAGYCSAFMGRPILVREVECRALGHSRCLAIGKPLEEWDDPEFDLKYLKFGAFANPSSHKRARKRERNTIVKAVPPKITTNQSKKSIVGVSPGFTTAMHMLHKVSKSDTAVLFTGESGVGKEVFARTLYSISSRSTKPYIAINCAAIPEELIESELFGVEKGAYTGAITSRPGRFERADSGTLFLDEISSLSFSAQGKLLRVLQEKELERVGDTKVRDIDVRVIVASNKDLRKEVELGNFRDDLFYRINIFPINIPPLRERRGDIPLLMSTFLGEIMLRHKKQITGFTERAVDALLRYSWPGNIRELENMIERAVILAPDSGAIEAQHLFSGGEEFSGALLTPDNKGSLVDLPDIVSPNRENNSSEATPEIGDWNKMAKAALAQNRLPLDDLLTEIGDAIVEEAVSLTDGNMSAAGRMLNLSYGQVAYRLRKPD